MLIIIIGPDGSGKTTIANQVQKKMKIIGLNSRHLKLNFEILPKIRDFLNPFLKNKIVNTHIEGEYYVGMKDKPISKFKGVLLVTWYSFDYFLGRFLLYRWNKANDVTIFARYYYDYYFQRGHLNTPHWYLNILKILIPKPDYIFTIIRDAKNIFDLKPELSVNEIRRQQAKIDCFLLNEENAYSINGLKGIEDTTQQIMKILNLK
jgi:thymidylate kinase